MTENEGELSAQAGWMRSPFKKLSANMYARMQGPFTGYSLVMAVANATDAAFRFAFYTAPGAFELQFSTSQLLTFRWLLLSEEFWSANRLL
jgi:hypothetical protein